MAGRKIASAKWRTISSSSSLLAHIRAYLRQQKRKEKNRIGGGSERWEEEGWGEGDSVAKKEGAHAAAVVVAAVLSEEIHPTL